MARANFQAFAVDAKGNILSGASVEVRDSSGALLAASAIFTGYTGSSAVSSNPFTVGSDGLIQFYVDGSQVLTITATSGASTATWSNVVLNELFTPSDYALNSSLGTAAQADLTTSATDTTAGRVLKVGDGGVLSNNSSSQLSDNTWNSTDFTTTMTRRADNDGPPVGTLQGGFQHAVSPGNVYQFATPLNFGSNRLYFRRFVPSNQSQNTNWSEFWTAANYQPETSLGVGVARKMKNKSGAAIADQGTIAGSSLKAVYTDSSGVEQESAVSVGGTWVNVSGMGIGNNEAAEFTKL